MKRNYNLDKFRGFTIISMVLFHLIYNINYYWPLSWYDGTLLNRIWQLSIALSFFTISGITSNFLAPRKNIKRGVITSLIGFIISLATHLFAPSQAIVWGVLNGLGLSMIIGGLWQKYVRANGRVFLIFIALFALAYDIPRGSLSGIGIFRKLYESNIFFLGFPGPAFNSTDYFPIIPWIFAYLFGYYLYIFIKQFDIGIDRGKDSFMAKIGRHSLAIYLAHQLFLYPLVTLIYNISK